MIGLLGVHVVLGHRYAAAWQSDLALWRWAHTAAPQKVRPLVNYHKAQIGSPR